MKSKVILERLTKLHPKSIDLSLTRIKALLNKLGNPQDNIENIIHIAGTNGKGSTLTFIKNILETAGYSVNSFISPHLVKFNERITLSGEEINDDYLCEILEYAEKINNSEPMTFFEITTAAAFLAFSAQKSDVLLLETGMGGRLDATNVIKKPIATVITPISYDHQVYLGDLIKEIALEKAHIIKPQTECISAYQPEQEALEIIKNFAAKQGVKSYQGGMDWVIKINDNNSFDFSGEKFEYKGLPSPHLLGEHQYYNAGTAIAALEKIRDIFPVKRSKIEKGIINAFWPARLQKLKYKGLDLWLDGGHNPHAALALEKVLQNWKDKPLTLITGMLKTKDAASCYQIISKYAKQIYTVDIKDYDVAYTAQELLEIIKNEGIKNVQAIPDFKDAIEKADKDSRILIFGSLYLAGKVLAQIS